MLDLSNLVGHIRVIRVIRVARLVRVVGISRVIRVTCVPLDALATEFPVDYFFRVDKISTLFYGEVVGVGDY